MKLYIVGIGPGEATQMTQRAQAALERSELIVGYTAYVDLVRPLFPEKSFLTTSMRGEVERCRLAMEQALTGRTVSLFAAAMRAFTGWQARLWRRRRPIPSWTSRWSRG